MLLGVNAKLYYQSGGSFGSPTWVDMSPVIGDVKFDMNWGKASVPTRNSKVVKTGKTIAECPLTFTVKQHLTNTIFLAVWTALISNTANMDLLVLNQPQDSNGARGVRGEFNLFTNSDDQALQNGLVYQIGAEPADTDNAFQTAVVASGSPVFTSL